MDPNEVITISDTESSASSLVLVNGPLTELSKIPNPEDVGSMSQNMEEVVTLSSVSRKSTERCPVTWNESKKKPNLHFLNPDTFYSPSPRSKVTHWLSENANNKHPSFLETQDVPELNKDSSIDSFTSFSTNKSSILVRQDYKKSDLSENQFVNKNNVSSENNRSSTIENHNETDLKVSNNPMCNRTVLVQKSVTIGNSQTFDSEQSEVDIEKIPKTSPLSVKCLVRSMSDLCDLQTKSEEKNKIKACANIPLSPETQKKIELCQYLKLMNMNRTDTRISGLTQNRRSTRVKHLALMSEKRELERKLNSEVDKKKGLKISDTDSRHSSDNDRGSKMSKKSNTSSNNSKTTSEHASPIQKNREEKNNRKPSEPRAKTPSKSLQVPEVSTTSTVKNPLKDHNFTVSTVLFRKSDSDVNNHHPHKDNSSNNSCKSEIITKKSFEQLQMNVESLKPLRKIRSQSTDSIHECFDSDKNRFCFVKSVGNIPNIRSDFDETIKIILKEEIEKIISPINRDISYKSTKNKEIEITKKVLRKRKAKTSYNYSNSKIPKLNGKIKLKTRSKSKQIQKNLERRERYLNLINKKKLRNRGRLKQISKIMLKPKKRKVGKKNKLKENFILEKDFKSSELIQHGIENNSNTVNNTPVQKEPTPNKITPNKTKKRLPEADIWKKYFTTEHRKAYIESIKYLEEEENKKNPQKEAEPQQILEIQDSPPCYGFKITEIKTNELDKLKETCKNIKISITPLPYVNTITGNGTYPDRNRPSSEDLEVDQLMSCKRMKDQATQKDCESPDAGRNTLQTDVTDPALADHSRCTSSTVKSSPNSWSLQTVESNPNPSTSRQSTLEVPCKSVNEDDIDSKISGTPKTSTTPLFPDDPLSIGQPEVVNISQIQRTTCTYVPLSSNGTEVKSLHHCLTQPKTKLRDKSRNSSPINQQNWEERLGIDKSPKTDRKTSQSHTIYLSNTNGAVMGAYYLDFNIIIVQELMVSFWNQSPLGNILGAQDMWIPKGNTRRMVLGNGCVHKESSETVISFDNTVAYIELWTKEHKSDKRERPVADIFIAIYLRLSRNGPDKKVLQLENIHGYANDVQYIVLKNARSIIVSWSVIVEGVSSTLVHCYHLSPDYQTVTSISKMQTVEHYVSSLHNIEDCDTLILGCGDYKITLWDLEHGYVVATIDLVEVHPQPRTVWAKRDRGFLFTLHHFSDGVLQLIAINSFDSTWKKLQTYKPDLDYENLVGVCMENGLLVAFYDTGVSCWNAQTGSPVLEDSSEDTGVLLPYGKHVVVVLNNQVHVRHALEYLITICPMEDS